MSLTKILCRTIIYILLIAYLVDTCLVVYYIYKWLAEEFRISQELLRNVNVPIHVCDAGVRLKEPWDEICPVENYPYGEPSSPASPKGDPERETVRHD